MVEQLKYLREPTKNPKSISYATAFRLHIGIEIKYE